MGDEVVAARRPVRGIIVDELTNAEHDDRWGDDKHEFNVVDREGNRLMFRVGAVFAGDDPHPVPGVWVSFSGWDDEYIVISPSTFRALAAHVERRLAEWERHRRPDGGG